MEPMQPRIDMMAIFVGHFWGVIFLFVEVRLVGINEDLDQVLGYCLPKP